MSDQLDAAQVKWVARLCFATAWLLADRSGRRIAGCRKPRGWGLPDLRPRPTLALE
jgi:hypothetical protein